MSSDGDAKPCGDDGAEPSGGTVARKLGPGLYLVATPIGNLGDVTLRALEVLGAADVVACEDTRVTRRLLDRHGVRARLVAYHEHNAARVRPLLLARLAAGERIALVSDAGTPLVSDPGYKLVGAAVAAGIAVVPIPGPSAVLAALAVAGLPVDRFVFLGFLPARAAQRRAVLRTFAAVPASLIAFESPRRLAASLADMAAVLGPRPAAVARELTKIHEEVVRGPLDTLAARYAKAPRGEVVVVVAPPADAAVADDATVDRALDEALSRLGPSAAAAEVARATGRPRRDMYARALERRRSTT